MEFDWLDCPFDLRVVTPREIEESFEDPFNLRLLPDLPHQPGAARYFCLGRTAAGRGVFSVFWTDGRRVRVLLARPMTPEETAFYDRRNLEQLDKGEKGREDGGWKMAGGDSTGLNATG